mmetsp:Transcript_12410/g.15307  ORF Transcript_12410/g.15307 Transcript_12410/m.15307 type:complete len:111 (+) Transcript_12410:270-602(+)
MEIEGKTNQTGVRAMMLEGAPKYGADLIPNYILWVDPEYKACIRYSCKENYLGVDVFHSLQIWTRTPIHKKSKQGQELMKQAHKLVNFNDQYVHFTDHTNCERLHDYSLL